MNIRKFFGHASDMAAIRALMMRYKVALDQADVEAVMQCHADADDISAVTLDSICCGKKEVRFFFERLFTPAVREGASRPPRSTFISIHENTAVLILEHGMQLLRPEPQVMEVRVSFMLIRQQNEWRILSSHLSAPRTAFVDVGEARH